MAVRGRGATSASKGAIFVSFTSLMHFFAVLLLVSSVAGGLPVARGAAVASPKWTSKYTRLDAETKNLLADEAASALRKLVPSRKSNGHVFGTHCALDATAGQSSSGANATAAEALVEAETETGLVLFRVKKEEVRGMDVSRATLTLHIRRYDLELDKVDFYYLDQSWNSAVSPSAVLDNLRAKQSAAFASVDLSRQDRGSWGSHSVDVTQYIQKASQVRKKTLLAQGNKGFAWDV